MPIAITREVSPDLAACELTHRERVPIDLARAREEHDAYEGCLEQLGCTLRRLPALEGFPDAVFVEDTAFVVGELAVIARPGAASRRGETARIASVLADYRPLAEIVAPGTLDGGDLLRVGRTVYVGASSRTNAAGIAQLGDALTPFGYRVVPVAVQGCLHLKSAACPVNDETVLLNPAYVDTAAFAGCRILEVDPAEPDAACVLRLDDTVLAAAAHAHTNARLERVGIRVLTVPLGELAKAEAGVTCCSVIVTT